MNAINSGGAARTICNPITLTGTGTLEGSLDLTLAGDITASGNPLGNGSQIVNNLPTSNTATLSGNIFLSANSGTGNWLAVAGTGNTVITGMISNAASAGAGAGSFIAGGTGTITFLHSNSYTGGTLVGGGTLLLGARDAINNGLVNLQADGTLAEDVPGALGGSASLSIYEASAYLSQSNDYSGGTTMGYGTLTIGNVSGSATGSGSVNINGGTLTGAGLISGNVNVANNIDIATLAPGPRGGIGTLTTGPLTIQAGSYLAIALNSNASTCDALISTGTVSLGGPQLSLSDLGNTVVPAGVVFPLVTAADGILGTFAGEREGTIIPVGASQFRLSYANPDEVSLTSLALATWNGSAGDHNWMTGTNWVTGSPPAADSALTFTGSNTSAFNNFPENTPFANIGFDTGAAPFTISGNAIQDAAITNNSYSVQTIDTDLNYAAGNTIQTNGNGGDVVINGNLTGSATWLAKNGAGVLTLTGSNTIGSSSGSFMVNSGTLRLTSAASFTNFPLHFTPGRRNGATALELWSDSPIASPNSQIFIDTGVGTFDIDANRAVGGDGTNLTHSIGTFTAATIGGNGIHFTNGNGYSLEIGTVALNAAQTLLSNDITGVGALRIGALTMNAPLSNVNFGGRGKTFISGPISGSGTLELSGSGVVSLNGADATASVAVSVNAGELGGTGQIAGAVTVSAGATIAPGTSGTPGTLTTGPLSLADGAKFSIQLNSDTQACDELDSSGAVALGTSSFALLSVTDLGASQLPLGVQFTILTAADGVSGIFAGLPQGSIITAGSNEFSISYSTLDDVLLTVVPEPASIGLLVFPLMLLRRPCRMTKGMVRGPLLQSGLDDRSTPRRRRVLCTRTAFQGCR